MKEESFAFLEEVEKGMKKDYCIFCGRVNSHDKECPAKIGVRNFLENQTDAFGKGKEMGWGFKADPEDPEWTLNQYRWNKLLIARISEEGITYGPKDKKVYSRVFYEAVRTKLIRAARTIEYHESEVDDAFIKFFKKRDLEKAREEIKEGLKELEQSINQVEKAVDEKQPKFKEAMELISKFRDEYLE